MKRSAAIAIFIFSALSYAGAQTARPNPPLQPAAKAPIVEHIILDRPRAPYTDAARENGVEGSVKLRVALLANGTVGEVSPVTYLGHGLTQQAVEAAKKIRFRPKMVNGVPVDVIITVEYRFTLYYEDADPDIRTKVSILNAPKPRIRKQDAAGAADGRISVDVFFGADGRVSVFKFVTEISYDQRATVAEAVEKIRFRPAVHKNGRKVGVTRVVVYELD